MTIYQKSERKTSMEKNRNVGAIVQARTDNVKTVCAI